MTPKWNFLLFFYSTVGQRMKQEHQKYSVPMHNVVYERNVGLLLKLNCVCVLKSNLATS